jgi:hypothetical protein
MEKKPIMPQPNLRKSESNQDAQGNSGMLTKLKNYVLEFVKKHKIAIFTVASTVLAGFMFKKYCLDKFIPSSDIMV